MVIIQYIRFNEQLPEKVFDSYMSLLPEKDRQNIGRFLRWQDREAALYGRLLLASGMDKFFKDSNLTLYDILLNDWGRPFFKNSRIDFNISHTDGCVVCIITDEGRVGIDIELIKTIDTDGFQKYMDNGQWEEIAADSSCASFYKYWTMKESVIKGEGRGLSIPLSDVKTDTPGAAVLYGHKWYLTEVFIDNRYMCHVAADFLIRDRIQISEVLPKDMLYDFIN